MQGTAVWPVSPTATAIATRVRRVLGDLARRSSLHITCQYHPSSIEHVVLVYLHLLLGAHPEKETNSHPSRQGLQIKAWSRA